MSEHSDNRAVNSGHHGTPSRESSIPRHSVHDAHLNNRNDGTLHASPGQLQNRRYSETSSLSEISSNGGSSQFFDSPSGSEAGWRSRHDDDVFAHTAGDLSDLRQEQHHIHTGSHGSSLSLESLSVSAHEEHPVGHHLRSAEVRASSSRPARLEQDEKGRFHLPERHPVFNTHSNNNAAQSHQFHSVDAEKIPNLLAGRSDFVRGTVYGLIRTFEVNFSALELHMTQFWGHLSHCFNELESHIDEEYLRIIVNALDPGTKSRSLESIEHRANQVPTHTSAERHTAPHSEMEEHHFYGRFHLDYCLVEFCVFLEVSCYLAKVLIITAQSNGEFELSPALHLLAFAERLVSDGTIFRRKSLHGKSPLGPLHDIELTLRMLSHKLKLCNLENGLQFKHEGILDRLDDESPIPSTASSLSNHQPAKKVKHN